MKKQTARLNLLYGLRDLLNSDLDILKDPVQLTVIKGSLDLFEWNGKMIDRFGRVADSDPDYYFSQYDLRSGYYCSQSENFLKDPKGKNEIKITDDDAIQDIFNWTMISASANVRDLAYAYREGDKVKSMVDEFIDCAAMNEEEARSYRNILKRNKFLSDQGIEKVRRAFLKYSLAKMAP